MKLLSILISAILLSILTTLSAQDYQNIMRSNVVENINGKDYYLHKVKNGETLYAIARAYHINVDIIRKANYGVEDDINPDQILKIPVRPEPQIIEADKKEAINYRRIIAGETLYSISKEYNVSVEELKAANGGLPDGLKTGMFIKIPVNDGNKPEVIETSPQDKYSKIYFEYQAKEKVSIYKLALRYKVSIDTIFLLNPGINEQLISGQIIKIPFSSGDTGFITHTIKKRQTVKKLAKKYAITVEQIKEINKYISRHLLVGQVIQIPLLAMDANDAPPLDSLALIEQKLLSEESRTKTQKEKCYESYHTGEYKVALLLPFYMSVYDSVIRMQNETDTKETDPEFVKSFVFIQFYEGFMMAIDSMKKTGLKVKLHVYNLEDDISQTNQLLQNPEFKQMDLIVGPVFNSNFKIVADFAKEHQINIVNPLSTREEITYGNPYVFQPQPINNNQYQTLVDYLNEHHAYSQIFIARHNPYRNAIAFEELRNVLDRQLESRKGSFTGLYHEILYSRDSTYTFEHTASADFENVVITYSDSKVFILDMLRKLNELRDTFNITILGMPQWKEIDGLELEDLNNLNARILSKNYTNYNLPAVRYFVKEYRNRYATEPKEYAFTGYNIGVYFLSALMKYGPQFNDCIQYFDMELLNTGFDFESSPGNGYQNINWKILGFENYQLKDISDRLETYDLSNPPGKYYKYMEIIK